MTPLKAKILRQIQQFGPINVAEFMTLCLLDPADGYYKSGDPLGAQGDFTTAPEISQMFGEMLGLCLAQAWVDQGRPTPFTLVELGPGRGTLMADILRITKSVPGFHAGLSVTLMETSPSLRARQTETLKTYDIHHIETLSDLPFHPIFLIANEFFDCLPIRQFKRVTKGWQEQLIAQQDGELGFVLGQIIPPDAITDHAEASIGAIVETAAALRTSMQLVSEHIAQHGGCALIIDYGEWAAVGDTLQAVENHKKTDPLANPGGSDLTAHVDFAALAAACDPGSRVSAMTSQGVLLERLGITLRAQSLAKHLKGDALESHINAHRRLTHPAEMGNLFKAIAITPKGIASPPGFD